ncbi:hypothetical protein F0562_004647 [Nyssa sinensis]|uniref:Photosystem I assembly factor PSA3, chloroplastic n=1 Tax=Nyssa sinensis TaxID=561372 RepID=A0A5J5C2C2_9ASTE|nr:hypothetical protein F0562_004647 [Nyssa sinensis]
MVVVTFASTLSSLQINLHTQIPPNSRHIYSITCKPYSPSLLYLRQFYRNSTRPNAYKSSNSNGVLSVRAYMENSNSISGFVNKVIGSLPVIGLVARILSDEGGVGSDTIDFAEFRRRVGKNCTITDSRAFYEFQDRRGRSGDPLYVLQCCWLAAVGAGLLKSEEILEGVARLRLSNDIEFEEENFIAMMNEAKEKRAKLNVPTPSIPMEVRAEKALEAIYVCCFGNDPIEEEDERLLCVMLTAVFPSVGQKEMSRIVKEKAKKVAEGSEEGKIPEPKPLSKEAVELQMKDLQFLKQNSES